MPRSDRLKHAKTFGLALVLTFVGWTLLADLSAVSQGYEREATDRSRVYADNAEYQITHTCRAKALAEQPDCIRDTQQAKRENQRDEQDLAAQKISAWWTRVMGAAALVGMGISIVGVYLIWTTFRETKESNVIAKAEAERNAQEAAAARKHIIQTERAILAIYNVHVSHDPAGRWFELFLSIKNTGKSNAWSLQIFTAERKSRLFPSRFTGHPASSLISNPDVHMTTQKVRLKVPRNFPVWIFGHLSYTTAHDAAFRTYFCCRLDGVPEDDGYGGQTNSPVMAGDQVDLPSNT